MHSQNKNLLNQTNTIIINDPFYQKYCHFVWRNMKPIKHLFQSKKNLQLYQLDLKIKTQTLSYQSQVPTKKKLFMDLDETLIHTQFQQNYNSDKQKINSLRFGNQTLIINVRPFCYQFLTKLSQLYDIIVFTASEQSYAKKIVTFLNKHTNNSIKHILTRNNCIKIQSSKMYFKDLRIFNNLEMKSCILVDNVIGNFYQMLDNGVPIKSFVQDQNDQQLKFLGNMLAHVASLDDVRQFIKDKFKVKHILTKYQNQKDSKANRQNIQSQMDIQ